MKFADPPEEPQPLGAVDHGERAVKALPVGAIPAHANRPGTARHEFARERLIGQSRGGGGGGILARIEYQPHAHAAAGGLQQRLDHAAVGQLEQGEIDEVAVDRRAQLFEELAADRPLGQHLHACLGGRGLAPAPPHRRRKPRWPAVRRRRRRRASRKSARSQARSRAACARCRRQSAARCWTTRFAGRPGSPSPPPRPERRGRRRR